MGCQMNKRVINMIKVTIKNKINGEKENVFYKV